MIEPAAQDAYIAALRNATAAGSTVVIATFALDGPAMCSGFPVQRYNATALAARLGSDFTLASEEPELHLTPSGKRQSFIYAVFKRR